MPVHEIQSLDEYKQIINSKAKVAVNFGAEWCGPCQMMNPQFKGYSEEYPGITFLYVDIDQRPDIAPYENLRGVPTFLFFYNGQRVDQYTGATSNGVKERLDMLDAR